MPDVPSDHIVYALGDDRPVDWPLLDTDGEQLAAGQFAVFADVRDAPLPDGTLLARFSSVEGTAEVVDLGEGRGWVARLIVTGSADWTWSRGGFDVWLRDPHGRSAPISLSSTWVNIRPYTELP